MITSRHTKETKIHTGITRNDNQLKSTSKLYESTVKIRHRKLHIYIHETEKERERIGQEARQSEMGWHRGGVSVGGGGVERRGTEGQTVRQEGGGGEQHRNTVRQRGDGVAQRDSETDSGGPDRKGQRHRERAYQWRVGQRCAAGAAQVDWPVLTGTDVGGGGGAGHGSGTPGSHYGDCSSRHYCSGLVLQTAHKHFTFYSGLNIFTC